MAASYLKLFVDSLEKYQKLNDSEFGRQVRAALRYKATGAEPDDLGREALPRTRGGDPFLQSLHHHVHSSSPHARG